MVVVVDAQACGRTSTSPLVDARGIVTGDAALSRAWIRVRSNAEEAGTLGRDLLRFEATLVTELGRLQRALRAGTWRPSRPRVVRIPKPSGGHRVLHVPPVGDRVVERAIATVLADLVDQRLSPWSFAFRPGRGVTDAVRALAALRDEGATHVARFDLSDCFGSVDHPRLIAALERFVDDAWLRSTVERVLERELPGLARDRGLVGIAQGSPLSPLLVNLVLDELDDRLVRAGFPAVRYADDLALAAADAAEAAVGLRHAEGICADLGFRLNPAKTAIIAFADVVPFLGTAIGAEHPPADPGADDEPPERRTLYASTRVVNLHLRRGQVRAMARDGEELLSVPVSAVGRIVVTGPTGVSAGLRAHAMTSGLDVVFLSRSGSWLGRYDGARHVDAPLRRLQYRLLDDEPRRVSIARAIVAGKIGNQRALLLRYGRRPTAERTHAVAGELGRLVDVALGAED